MQLTINQTYDYIYFYCVENFGNIYASTQDLQFLSNAQI